MNNKDENFKIRRIRENEWRELRDLRLRALKTDHLPFGSTYEETKLRPETFWQELAQKGAAGEKTVVFVACFPEMLGMVRGDLESDNKFHVYSMWVAPEARGKGVAEALLAELENWILASGGTEAELFVADKAEAARHLYARLGYVDNGKRETSPHPGVTEIGLCKKLGIKVEASNGHKDLYFREAKRSDLEKIILLLADDIAGRKREVASTPAAPEYVKAFEEIERDPNNMLIVGINQNEVVAATQLTFIPTLVLRGTKRAQVEGVRVSSTMRNQGVGKQLMIYAMELAKKRGCGLIQLTTNKWREDAIAFYKTLGFEPTHEGMRREL